jgi:hypothetical protein
MMSPYCSDSKTIGKQVEGSRFLKQTYQFEKEELAQLPCRHE